MTFNLTINLEKNTALTILQITLLLKRNLTLNLEKSKREKKISTNSRLNEEERNKNSLIDSRNSSLSIENKGEERKGLILQMVENREIYFRASSRRIDGHEGEGGGGGGGRNRSFIYRRPSFRSDTWTGDKKSGEKFGNNLGEKGLRAKTGMINGIPNFLFRRKKSFSCINNSFSFFPFFFFLQSL